MSLGDVIWITYRTQGTGNRVQSSGAIDETEIAPRKGCAPLYGLRSQPIHTGNLFIETVRVGQDQAPPAGPALALRCLFLFLSCRSFNRPLPLLSHILSGLFSRSYLSLTAPSLSRCSVGAELFVYPSARCCCGSRSVGRLGPDFSATLKSSSTCSTYSCITITCDLSPPRPSLKPSLRSDPPPPTQRSKRPSSSSPALPPRNLQR